MPKKCPKCGGKMHHEIEKDRNVLGEMETSVELSCMTCGNRKYSIEGLEEWTPEPPPAPPAPRRSAPPPPSREALPAPGKMSAKGRREKKLRDYNYRRTDKTDGKLWPYFDKGLTMWEVCKLHSPAKPQGAYKTVRCSFERWEKKRNRKAEAQRPKKTRRNQEQIDALLWPLFDLGKSPRTVQTEAHIGYEPAYASWCRWKAEEEGKEKAVRTGAEGITNDTGGIIDGIPRIIIRSHPSMDIRLPCFGIHGDANPPERSGCIAPDRVSQVVMMITMGQLFEDFTPEQADGLYLFARATWGRRNV